MPKGNFIRSNGGEFTALCTIGQIGHQGMTISNLLNLSSAILGHVAGRLQPFFNAGLCIFHHTEEAISFAAQVAVVFCLLVQLEGRGKGGWRVAVILLVKIKAFLRRHHVIHLPVNDTSSSYSSLNDLVCVALLVARETAGGSLEMSLVIVWRCGQARREMETKTGQRDGEKVHRSHLRAVAPCI